MENKIDVEILKSIPTKYLAEELARREGVSEIWVDAYDEKDIHVSGPAQVLVNID